MIDPAFNWLDANFISILNGLAIGLLLFTLAVGLSLIFGLMDVLNLAHGAVYALGSYLVWALVRDGQPYLAGLVVAVAAGALLGVGLAAAVRPVASRGHLDQALLTLGISLVIADIISGVWGNGFHSVRAPALLHGSVRVFGDPYPVFRLAVMCISLALTALLYLIFACS